MKKYKKFSDLPQKEQDELRKIISENQRTYLFYKTMLELRKCFLCKTKFPNGVLEHMDHPEPGYAPYKYNGDFLFHLKETHGIVPEIFELMQKEVLENIKRRDKGIPLEVPGVLSRWSDK